MANRIVGLDIGSWAVKAVTLEWQRQLEVVDVRAVPLIDLEREFSGSEMEGAAVPPLPGEQADGGEGGGVEDGPAPVDEIFPDVPEGQGGDWSDEGGPVPGAADPPWAAGGADEESGEEEEEGAQRGSEFPLWTQALAKLQQQGVFEDVHQIITSFPDGRAVTLHLDVPFERKVDVAEILPHLLVDELPISPSEIVHDFIVVPGKGPDLWEALVGVVEREEMAAFLRHCKAVKTDPAIVGVPELMLRYAGDQSVDPGVESYGIIDFGHRFTRLLIMSRGKPVVAHTTQRGGQAVTEALAENFQINQEQARQLKHREGVVGAAAHGGDMQVRKLQGTIEESLRPLVRDLRRTFQSAYAKYRVAVDKVYICGGGSRLRGIEDFLGGEFDVPVEPLQVDRGVVWTVGASQRAMAPEMTLALGCALQKPLDEGDQKLIDFRQGPFVYRGKSSYLRTQMVRFGAIAAVLFVLLAGVLLMQRHDQQTQLRAMEQAVAQQTQELFGESLDSAAAIQSRLEGEGAMNRNFVPQMSAYEQFYRTIAQVSQEYPLTLSRIEVDTDRSLIQLVGITDSAQSVEMIANEVNRFECLTDVRTDRVNVRGDNEVQFELQISSGCS